MTPSALKEVISGGEEMTKEASSASILNVQLVERGLYKVDGNDTATIEGSLCQPEKK